MFTLLLLGGTSLGAGMAGCGGGSNSLPQSSGLSPSAVVGLAAPKTTAIHGAVKTASAASQYVTTVLADNPVAYYQLNDTGSTMTDSGPNAISGSYGSDVHTGAAAISAGTSSAATFPGGSTYDPKGFAYSPMSAVLQPPQVTLEAWVKIGGHNATSHDLPIAVYGSNLRGLRYGLLLRGMGPTDCLEFQQRNLGQTPLLFCSNTRVAVGSTYHVVVTSNGSSISMYLNGVLDNSVAYTGTIDYTPYFTDGFQIGGADQTLPYASASFPGTVAQVALYSTPLSPARITAHFLAGQLIPPVVETPSDADTFVDSIGVNAHFDNPHGIYGTQYSTVRNLLVASGIRHIRESMTLGNAGYISEMQDLAAAGIRASYVTQLGYTQAQIQAWPGMVGSSFEAFEAPNEQDDVGNPNWLAPCIAFQQSLYSWVKSDPQIAKYPVLGPALVNLADFSAVGNLSSYLDYGNIHDYFSVFNPGTTGWGTYHAPYGFYGSIQYNTNLGRVVSGTKPIIATETGYGTIAGNPLTLDLRTDLRYMTRLFFEQFNGGIVRSYTYEFMDEGGTDVFSNFGMIQTNLQPKPAYTGVKSLIAALADPGAPFTTTPLAYNLTGFVNSVHHTLLQRRNGQYVMAIWLEVPDWVTLNNAGGDIIVPPQSVTLTTAKAFSSAAISTMDENGNLSTSPLSWNGTTANISVTDKVSLITLTP